MILCAFIYIYYFIENRAEKSEVLNEEEQSLERQIELIRGVCQNVSKKVHSCLHTAGQGNDVEKRMVLFYIIYVFLNA